MRRRSFVLVYISIFIGAMQFACDQNSSDNKGADPIQVKTDTVIQKDSQMPIHATGKLASTKEMKLSFKTGGIIKNIYHDEGDKIKKGTKLATLNLSEINAKLQEAKASLNKAKRDFKRTKALYQDSVATKEQLQNVRTALKIARSKIQTVRFNKQHSIITAPSNGTVLRKFASENEIIGIGRPVFLFASTDNRWVIKAHVTDKDVVKINKHDSASIKLDAYPQQTFSGTVKKISNAANPYTGLYEIEINLDRQPKHLFSGFIASVDIFPSQTSTFKLIPADALIEASGKYGYVYKVQGDSAVKRKITIVDINNSTILTSAGLKAGAPVIVRGAHYITPQSKIKVVD